MAKTRIPIWLLLIVGAISLPVTALVGLWTYKSVTTPTLHPDPQQIRSVTRSTPSPEWAGAVERGRQTMRAALTKQNLPGLSVAVAVGQDIVWAEGFGWADLQNQVAVAPETRFRVSDASKTLTSAAVGLLLEKEALRLDDEIQVRVPQFPKKRWPVTLRQLMAETAGVRTEEGSDGPLSNTRSEDGNQAPRCTRTTDGLQLDNFAEDALLFEPGTKYSPSSYGWILVSAAIESAADEPFLSFMRTQVFEPLGMRDTTVDVTTDVMPSRSTFYFVKFGLARDTRYGPKPARVGDYSCYAGAAAFLSTPSDLVRFGMGINGGKFLTPATVKLLQTPQRLTSGAETGHGLGWELETHPLEGQPARMAGHGSQPDFIGGTTSLMTFPERGLTVAVMANISFADTKSIALEIARAFANRAR
ncbi:MAG TPA: serine hydrolase domain-containing protein [Vicinamibacterales bacterium]|nr:serine hydrolase domain-containing protein [Vicinamibacterales bacterium]